MASYSEDLHSAALAYHRLPQPGKLEIQAIKPLDPATLLQDAVRGQYDAGRVLGKQVRAYRQEPDVAPNSTT